MSVFLWLHSLPRRLSGEVRGVVLTTVHLHSDFNPSSARGDGLELGQPYSRSRGHLTAKGINGRPEAEVLSEKLLAIRVHLCTSNGARTADH